jgi:hypothetical protein
MKKYAALALLALALALVPRPLAAQDSADLKKQLDEVRGAQQSLDHRLDELGKAIDDVAFFVRLNDIAVVDKWRICGPPQANPKNPKAPGAVNPVRFYTYTFVPKDRKPGEKLPLLVLPHGGVHADFTTYHVHILRWWHPSTAARRATARASSSRSTTADSRSTTARPPRTGRSRPSTSSIPRASGSSAGATAGSSCS